MTTKTRNAGTDGRRAQNTRCAWWLVVVLAALFCFSGLSNHPLRASDEPRVAGIAWEMELVHSAPTPYLGGEPFLEHPPLFYIVLGDFIETLGQHEWVARLPSAIASFITLLIVFDLGCRVADPIAGLSSVLALASIRSFMRYSHKALVDPMLMLFVLLGFCAYLWSVWDLRRRAGGTPAPPARVRVSATWMFGVYVAASFAYYVKGPIGIIAIAGPIAFDVLVFRRFRALRSKAHLLGIPVLFGVVASWPWLLHSLEGDAAFREFVIQNGLYRVAPAAGAYYGGHEAPFWSYIVSLPADFTWWLAVLPAVAVWISRGKFPVEWHTGALRFLALVFPAGLLLLSIPGTKRELYLLPFMPPIALAIGAWITAMCRSDPARSRVERVTGVVIAHIVSWVLRPIGALLAWRPVRNASRSFLGPEWSELGADLREDSVRVATDGPVRAPLRMAWIVFTVAIAWNLFGYPNLSHARDLGPMAREMAADFGESPIVGYRLTEALRGALPFYTGKIAKDLHSDEELELYLSNASSHLLITPGAGRFFLAERFQGRLLLVKTWERGKGGYALYEVVQGPQQIHSEIRSEGDR